MHIELIYVPFVPRNWFQVSGFGCQERQKKLKFPSSPRKVKAGFGNWILGFEIYLIFGACSL